MVRGQCIVAWVPGIIHWAHKNLFHISLKVLFLNKWRKKTGKELTNPGLGLGLHPHLEKGER